MKRITRILVPCLALATLVPALSGCVGVAAVGVGAGALMAADRRLSETYIADQGIEVRVSNKISEKFGDKVHVNVTSFNRTVLLTGEVPDAQTKDEVEKIATASTEVRRISNELQIAANTDLASRSNDTYITSKVKARFLDASSFSLNIVKVITENGTVYLMGLVTQREADAAVDIARTTGGVQRVVRVFELIPDDQARQLDSRSNNAGAAAGKK